MAKSRIALTIDPYLPNIVSTLQAKQVVIVQAAPGAGKTTRIPQAILAAFPDQAVIMTQTKRIAVRWNGRRVADELGCKPGELVGWRLRGRASVTSAVTRLTLQIDQTLINQILWSGQLPEGILIVDEAHERTVTIDLLLGLIKQYLPNSPHTRVLLLSAVADTEKFAQYFNDAPCISVEGQMYPVSTEVVQLLHGEHHTSGAARATAGVLKRFGQQTLAVEDVAVSKGTIIVLLPGKEDIIAVLSHLSEVATLLGLQDRVQLMSCHSETAPNEQDAIQAPVADGVLRVVCGTELLRSSVTIPETMGVIDSLQVKRLIVDVHGVTHLAKVAVSRAEADDGKGRAGRTQPGFYMPVSFQDEYAALRPYPQPAILREPITHGVLQVAAAGLDIRTFPLLDRPKDSHIETAIRRLQRVDALDGQEKITSTGYQLLKFPLDPERAVIILAAETLGVLPEAIIVSAVLSLGNSIFFWPDEKIIVDENTARKVLCFASFPPCAVEEVDFDNLPAWAVRKNDTYVLFCAHEDFPLQGGAREVIQMVHDVWKEDESDFAMIVRAFRAFKAEESRLQGEVLRPRFRHSGQNPNWEVQLREWCALHFLSFKHVRMAEQIIYEIREELDGLGIELETDSITSRTFDTLALSKALVTGLADNLAVKVPYSNTFRSASGSFILSYDSACPQDASLIIVGGVRRTKKGGLFAELAAPLTLQMVKEVVPGMIEARIGLYPRYDECRGVVSTMELYLNNRFLEAREVLDPSHPEAARLCREFLNSPTG